MLNDIDRDNNEDVNKNGKYSQEEDEEDIRRKSGCLCRYCKNFKYIEEKDK